MNLASERVDQILCISAQDPRIDAAAAIQFKDAMRALTDNVSGRIVLDLSSVDFIDSSGLGAIVAAMKQLSPAQKLELAGLRPAVSKVFKLTRMDSVFTIHASREAATSVAADAK